MEKSKYFNDPKSYLKDKGIVVDPPKLPAGAIIPEGYKKDDINSSFQSLKTELNKA